MKQEYDYQFKVVLVGDLFSGKSGLFFSFLEHRNIFPALSDSILYGRYFGKSLNRTSADYMHMFRKIQI